MAKELDEKRSKTNLIIFIIFIITLIIFVVYILYGYLTKPTEVKSKYTINDVTNTTKVITQESEEYRELLENYNDIGVQKAKDNNDSFVSNISLIEDNKITHEVKKEPSIKLDRTSTKTEINKNKPEQNSPTLDNTQKKLIEELILKIKLENTAPIIENANIIKDDPYKDWVLSFSSSSKQKDISSSKDNTNIQIPIFTIIPALTRVPAEMDTAIDSDNSTSTVIAKIKSGLYSGAILYAQGNRLNGDGVTVTFSRMYFNGVTYRINAVAQNDDTFISTIATNVNHRYWERAILPAIFSAIGNAGDLYKDSNKSILTTNNSVVESTARRPDGEAVAGVAIGGMATNISNVLKQDAAKLPVKQITVDRHQIIAVQFIDAVNSNDDLAYSKNISTNSNQTQLNNGVDNIQLNNTKTMK